MNYVENEFAHLSLKEMTWAVESWEFVQLRMPLYIVFHTS